MPNCPNSYASLHAGRPSIQWAGGIGQFISHDKSPLTTRTRANVGWILKPPSHRAKSETQVKLITVTYWIQMLLVVQSHNHGIYKCITVWCVIKLLTTNLQMFPNEIYEMQYCTGSYLSVWRYKSVKYFSIVHRVGFLKAVVCAIYLACITFTLLFRCSHTLVSSCCRIERHWCN